MRRRRRRYKQLLENELLNEIWKDLSDEKTTKKI